MRDGWQAVPLGDLAEWTSGGTPRKGVDDYWNGDIPWISGATLTETRLTDSARRITPEGLAHGSRLAAAGSTLILVRGMSLHEEIRIGHAMRPLAFNQDVKALAPREGVDPWFLTYALEARVPILRGLVHAAGHGTGVLATDQLRALGIDVPPLDVQQRIAAVLSTFDDLIEEERQAVRRLDDLVRTLGRRFLVTLDGTETAALGDLAEITKGYSYKSAELTPGSGWLVSLKNVGRDGTFQSRGYKPLSASPKPKQIVDTGDLLVAQTDLTQNREVIGRPVRVRRGLVRGDLAASLDLVIVRPGPGVTPEYLYAVLDSAEFRSHALGYCNGTTVVHMATAAVPTFLAPVPEAGTLRAFSDLVRTLRSEADSSEASADRLSQVRDELLPLLMSGAVTAGEVAA